MTKGKSPAVKAAKKKKNKVDENVVTLNDGSRARLTPVSSSLIEEIQSNIKDPDVPMWENKDKGRKEPNPSDPTYIKELAEADRARSMAVYEAMCMFGVDLLDGLPEDDGWLKKLRYMSKRGSIDIDDYDLEDEFDLEFLYKRFIAVGNNHVMEITKLSGVTEEDIAEAEKSFQGDEE